MSLRIVSRNCAAASFIVFILLILPAAHSSAGTINSDAVPTVSISVDSLPGPVWKYTPAEDALEAAAGQGRGRKLGVPFADGDILGNRAGVVLDLEFDPDPFVENNLLISNTTSSTQIYTVGVALPTTFPAPNTISGSILTGVIDSSGDGTAIVATVSPTPIYRAQIDGVTVATLQDHPFSVSIPPNPNSATESFGPTLNLLPVTSDIGIVLRFSLTAGDTATILSRFEVVPEPASLGLGAFALFAVAAVGWRRRR